MHTQSSQGAHDHEGGKGAHENDEGDKFDNENNEGTKGAHGNNKGTKVSLKSHFSLKVRANTTALSFLS